MPGERRRAKLRALLKTAGVPDADLGPFERAFVHESASREGAGASNERLEFYGDAILGYVTARWLVVRYPDANEGDLSRRKHGIVSGDACARSAMRLGLGDLIILGEGAAKSGGARNQTILADAFEAFVAALAETAGLDRAARFLETEHIAHADLEATGERDAKTALQEFAQGVLRVSPMYFERAEGPPQERRFTSQVRIGDEVLGEGIGPSKKAAQQSAAAMALSALRSRYSEVPEPPASKDDGRVIALDKRRRRPRSPHPEPGAPVRP